VLQKFYEGRAVVSQPLLPRGTPNANIFFSRLQKFWGLKVRREKKILALGVPRGNKG